jgi:dihydroorotase
MGLLIRGGRLIDPGQELSDRADVLIEEGRIAAVGVGIAAGRHEVVDAGGLLVVPGLIDMHVHLRDPGQTHKEDIRSGAASAVAGGFTTVACMPNTDPPLDHPVALAYVRSRAEEAVCRVVPIAAITRNLAGRELAPLAALAAEGAVAFSDDGAAVADAGLLRSAMRYVTMTGRPIIEHCEDPALSAGGVVHDGPHAAILGLPGQPAESEAVIVARDLLLAEATGQRLHIAHVSSAISVRLIAEAKRRGVPVTAEVTPHHLVLTDGDVGAYDTHRKMNPPLRGAADRDALRTALADGTIDVIATDHAPHAPEEVLVEFDRAPFGVIGLETAVGVILTHLVAPGLLSLDQMVRAMSWAPARILGLPGGTLAVGSPADVTLIDPHRSWTVRAEALVSRSRNTPFDGWTLTGKAVLTIVGGRPRYSELSAVAVS